MAPALTHAAYEACELCPRRCGARRAEGRPGLCGMSSELRIARSALHLWEEPPISGEAGSGAVFFSGCPLRCVFCQNHEISSEGFGLPVTTARLAEMLLELQGQGALNVNLVTPLHFAPHVCEAVSMARAAGLTLPIVCNTSGYERVEVVRALAGVVDVWLTDFKYASGTLAGELSAAPDYPEVAAAALAAMVESVRAAGGRLLAEDGAMRRGVIVRHLVLPSHADDSCAVLDRVWEIAGNEVDLSVMNQYTPNEACRRAGGALSRAVSDEEYEIVLCHADDLGFERIWWQEGGTVSESFVPAFDATGVEGPELACPAGPQAL
ncbi:radical SAM protein [Olsenella uli]|uniref:4Fe-4S cluster-binding domain-containing protein n=1 Tax=Olsenella uli TaxID=133926 RepID=UPI0019564E9F|nr:4Fe-4S cluster-binding domain-containing protein [Olsenella uli]MBM6675302.1 radical SAM protein [Olsenella uli]